MTTYILIAYGSCMIAFCLNLAEQARENKADDPLVEELTSNPLGRALMAAHSLVFSILWPWYAFAAALRWMAPRLSRTADRLRAYAEDGADETR